jgi:molybdenum cofactor guanylyltransferase
MQTLTPSFNQHITGLILAGGRATRMHQLDKGLQKLDGTCLIEHVIRRFAHQVPNILINANRNQATYAQFGYPVIADVRINFPGPLAGLEAGLLQCKTAYLLCVPCDAPFLPLDLADRLFKELEKNYADVAVACSGAAQNRCLQPVFCLLKVEHLQLLQSYLNTGGRKMDGWFKPLNMVEVYFENESEFTNLNTLAELSAQSSSEHLE